MELSNKRMAMSSLGKKLKQRAKVIMRKIRLIEEIYADAPHCTLKDLERRNSVQTERNENNHSNTTCNPSKIGRDKEANIIGNTSTKALKVDGEKRINDLAMPWKSVGIKRSSSSSNDETSTNVEYESRRKKLRKHSDENSKQPRIILKNKKKHAAKESGIEEENKIELSNNIHYTLSDSLVKDQTRAGIESFSGTDTNLLQLSNSLGRFEDFEINCKNEVSIDSEGAKGNSFPEAIPIPGPPGSFLPSPHMNYSDQDLIDRDSSDSLMSNIFAASTSPQTDDIHKKPAAIPVLRLMGKDLIVVNIATE